MGAVSNVISKYSVGDISPISLAFYRWLVATFVMTPFLMRGFLREFDKIVAIKSLVFLVALTGVTLFNIFVYYAMHYTSTTSVAIVTSMFPIFVMLFGLCINKDRLKLVQVISIILASVGALVIVTKGDIAAELSELFSNYGDFLALIATISYGIYTFAFRSKPEDVSFYSFSYATFLLGTIMLFPFYMFDIFYLENSLEVNLQNVSAILCLGVAVSVVGMLVFNMTILKLGYNLASIIFYLMPAFTAIMATTLLHEDIEHFHFIGMMLILVGVNLPITAQYIRKKDEALYAKS